MCVSIEDTERITFSDVSYTCYCKKCGKEGKWMVSPIRFKKFLKGLIDSEEAFEGSISEEDAFLMVFKICVNCNGGYDIDGIDAYPGGNIEKIQ